MRKKIILLATGIILSTISCNKDGGNKGIISDSKQYSSSLDLATLRNQGTEETYRYVAEDGSSALATVVKTPKGNYISINSNNKTINVKETESTPTKTIYDENTVHVRMEGDSIIITQDNAVIGLKKARGQ